MVSLRYVEEQLEHVGCNFKFWGRTEVRELANVLMPQEQIAQAANGSYEGGFALLCVTNYRVLLIDRKPMLLTIEDIRYDMLSEVDFHNRLLGATIRIMTPTRTLEFSSWSQMRLRKCLNYIQQRVMEIRQHGLTAAQLQTQVNGLPPQIPNSGAGFSAGMGFSAQFPDGMNGSAGRRVGVGGGYAPINPYTKSPVLIRRRRFPGLY